MRSQRELVKAVGKWAGYHMVTSGTTGCWENAPGGLCGAWFVRRARVVPLDADLSDLNPRCCYWCRADTGAFNH